MQLGQQEGAAMPDDRTRTDDVQNCRTISPDYEIMREGEELRDGCGKKRAIHVAHRCSNELRRVSALRHSRHEQRYAASLRPKCHGYSTDHS
jgi:hypothetical protein